MHDLPETGSVHRQAADRPDRPQDAPYFNPPGPAKDGTPSAIVSGFLVAMQANPQSTSVARKFLSERARETWKPNRGTIVYEAFRVSPTSTGATVRLADTRRLDARGGLRGASPGGSETLNIKLVSEGGQWRIDNPMNALVVPTSFFDRSFARFNLYFYDQTGRVLLPDPVFIPRGEQTATNLVRGLLAGRARPWTRSAGRRCRRGPTWTCRSWSRRAGSPRCHSPGRCCGPHRASSRGRSTSWPGRCARCRASSGSG